MYLIELLSSIGTDAILTDHIIWLAEDCVGKLLM